MEVFTYVKDSDLYTNECNEAIDYIMSNLAGVTIVDQEENLVQIEATPEAAKSINMLCASDMIELFKGTIKDVQVMLDWET